MSDTSCNALAATLVIIIILGFKPQKFHITLFQKRKKDLKAKNKGRHRLLSEVREGALDDVDMNPTTADCPYVYVWPFVASSSAAVKVVS